MYAFLDRDDAPAVPAPAPTPPAASSARLSWAALLRLKDESVCPSYDPDSAKLLPEDRTLPLDRTLLPPPPPVLESLPLDDSPCATASGTYDDEEEAVAAIAPAPASFDAR